MVSADHRTTTTIALAPVFIETANKLRHHREIFFILFKNTTG
jgi:hypothetical protein